MQIEIIIQFAKTQEKSVILKKGELYGFMKEQMPYEEWLKWLQGIKVSKSTAFEYIQLATEYKVELTSNGGGSKLSRNQMRAIHKTGAGHQILAKGIPKN